MRRWLFGVVAAGVGGIVLRLSCLDAEFWLDEIWSFQLAHAAGGVAGIFRLKHDNNHPLNSLWLLACPTGVWWGWYRLHAVVAGLAAIALAGWAGRRHGRADAVFAAVLVAGCSWLVLASTEARGYALAVACALAAFLALADYLDRRTWPPLVAFWVAAVLGFLSHLTFVHAYLGFVVWSHRRFARTRTSSADEIRRLAVCHGPVAAFFAPYYLLCVRGMEIGGGPPAAVGAVAARLVSVGLGGPDAGGAMALWLLAGVTLFIAGLWLLYRAGRDEWLFYLVAVVGSPALFLLRPPPFVFERYFLICFVFFLLLTAHVLAALWRMGEVGRWLSGFLLAAFLAGNTVHVERYVAAGRGEFHQALEYIAAHDEAAEIVVSGDHEFRVRKYMEFYAAYLNDPRPVVYRDRGDGAAWLLVHRLPGEPPPDAEERDAAGHVYRQVQAYPSLGPTAWGWYVYAR